MNESDLLLVDLYKQANKYINEGLIRFYASLGGFNHSIQTEKTRKEWMEWFLLRIEHPEQSFDAIHVGGTSGKGSVCMMIAEILRAAGVRTGLHVSPYVQVATEKIWVNGLYASAQEYSDLVHWIRPIAEACRKEEVPLHGMASVALVLEYFRREKVKFGVVEVGVGGRNDITNVLKTRVAVITSIGLDHLQTLGPTLEDIAWHKAGIIKPGCRAVILDGPGVKAAQEQANAAHAPLRVIKQQDFDMDQNVDGEIQLSFYGKRFHLENITLAMKGEFQAQNAALAIAAIEELDPKGDQITEKAIRDGLSSAKLPARIELIAPSRKNICSVLLDGAHNPDKLAGLIKTIGAVKHKRLLLVHGAVQGHVLGEQLVQIARKAACSFVTAPLVYAKPAQSPDEIKAFLKQNNIKCVRVESDPFCALAQALDMAKLDDLIVITGSIYLAGQLRNYWYSEEEVLLQRKSWPRMPHIS